MNNTDDQLINKFMQAHKREISDNGFSRRVLHRLPRQTRILADLLTAISIIVSGILFYAFDGITLIYQAIAPVFQQSTILLIENLNLQTWIPIIGVVIYLSIQKAIALSE